MVRAAMDTMDLMIRMHGVARHCRVSSKSTFAMQVHGMHLHAVTRLDTGA
jgi:hypothetical protein